MIANVHEDEPVYVIGGGSSLIGFDFKKLKDKITIGCNKAAFIAETDYLTFFDLNFMEECRGELEAFPGTIITMDSETIFLDREHVRCKHWEDRYQKLSEERLTAVGLSHSFNNGVNTGGNSGHFGLQLAYLMGANPIYLLGMDMQFGYGGTKWFYKGTDVNGGEKQYEHMKQSFNYAAIILEQQRVKVYNCSPISKLKGFEYYSLEDI